MSSYNKSDEHIDDELFDEDYDSDTIIGNISFNSNDFISKPIKSKTCTVDENIVQLQYPLSNEINM